MNRKEMQDMFEEFLSSLQNEHHDDWYGTDREVGQEIVRLFMLWKFSEEIAKEERYKQYLELKREFEPSFSLEEIKSFY